MGQATWPFTPYYGDVRSPLFTLFLPENLVKLVLFGNFIALTLGRALTLVLVITAVQSGAVVLGEGLPVTVGISSSKS